MIVKKEKEFINQDLRKLKGSAFLKKLGLIEKLVILSFDFICFVLRKIFTDSTISSNIIVIIALHRLGDSVFTIPAIMEIYKYYLDYKIFIICYPETEDIYAIKFPQNCLIAISKSEFKLSRRVATSSVRSTIKKLNPEIVFDITGTPASSSLIWGLKTKEKVGINIRYFKNLYNSYSPIRKLPHFVDIYLDVIKLKIPISHSSNFYQFNDQFNKNVKIIIHPFAIIEAKEWKLIRYLELAKLVSKENDVEIITPPGFIEMENIDEFLKEGIPVTITASVMELISKIKECTVFISNDSGPTYIANLLGKATFTIYGPTNPSFSFPFGQYHRFIKKELLCTQFQEKVCHNNGGINCPSYECMNLLTVSEVYSSLKIFLDELGINKLDSSV